MDNNTIVNTDKIIAAITPLLIAVVVDDVEACIHFVGHLTNTYVVEIPSIETESVILYDISCNVMRIPSV